jgi:transposase
LEPSLHGQLVHCGQKGGAATGRNPTDRGKPSTKRHLITDRRGILLAFLLTGANVHDSIPFEDLLDAVPPIADKRGRPKSKPDKPHADKAYDHRRCRRACLRRRIKPRLARCGVDTSQKLGAHRWVIERSFTWFNKFRRLTIRYERRLDNITPSPQSPAQSSACEHWEDGFERRSKPRSLARWRQASPDSFPL